MFTPNIVIFALCAASAIASPPRGSWGPPDSSPQGSSGWRGPCLSDEDAQQVADNFFIITGGEGTYNATVGEAAIADNYTDYSGSVSSIINGGADGPKPLLGPTFSTKQSFLDANAAQPATKFEQLAIWHTCNVVFQRFLTQITPQPALGISIFEVAPAPAGNLYPWQIHTTYGELNGIAFLVDRGIFTPSNSTS